jgi:hypothetical protein
MSAEEYTEEFGVDEQQQRAYQAGDPAAATLASSTFITGVDVDAEQYRTNQTDYDALQPYDPASNGAEHQGEYQLFEADNAQQQAEESQQEGLSLDQLMVQVEKMMREYEQNAQYVDAERARQHLESLKKRKNEFNRRELSMIQQEDVRVFFEMVAQHQENFDKTWAKRFLEHKLRADDMIDGLKKKHDEQQHQLYEELRKKRIPKFSVELLNLRKRQVLLAKAKKYLLAEKLKRKADVMESLEIDKIRRAAKQDNQLRFEALLKQQQWDRSMLAAKLRTERQHLLEAKAQDFQRLKNRLRNAEAELKRTHVRQGLLAEGKLHPVYSTLGAGGVAPGAGGSGATGKLRGGGASQRLSHTGSAVAGGVPPPIQGAMPAAGTLNPHGKPSVRSLTGAGSRMPLPPPIHQR